MSVQSSLDPYGSNLTLTSSTSSAGNQFSFSWWNILYVNNFVTVNLIHQKNLLQTHFIVWPQEPLKGSMSWRVVHIWCYGPKGRGLMILWRHYIHLSNTKHGQWMEVHRSKKLCYETSFMNDPMSWKIQTDILSSGMVPDNLSVADTHSNQSLHSPPRCPSAISRYSN